MDALDRTLPPTRRVLGDVDPAQPLDTTHPLLDELEAFWLPLPRTTGGSRLYDLSSVGQHGDLIDASFESRVEGTGIVGNVNFGVIDALTGGGGKSYLSYTYISSGKQRNIFKVDDNSDASGTKLVFQQKGFRKDDDQFTVAILGETRAPLDVRLNLGEFNTVGAAIPTNNLPDSSLFINGVKGQSYDGHNVGSLTIDTAANPATYTPQTPFTIATAIFDRVITETDAKVWEDQARRGFPDLLNRRDSVGLLGGGGGVSVTVSGADMQHGHTLEQGSINVSFTIVGKPLQHGHSLETATTDVSYQISGEELRHDHTLGQGALDLIFDIAGDDLTHAHTLESGSLQVSFLVEGDDLRHVHRLKAAGIIVDTDVTNVSLRAEPLYNVTLTVDPKLDSN